MTDVTHILSAMEHGDPQAADKLLPLVYEELRALAAQRLAQEKPGQTLQGTALVHEAYLRLLGRSANSNGVAEGNGSASSPTFANRGHFFAAAAEAMRRILVENARRRRSTKHGGGLKRLDLEAAHSLAEPPVDELLALNDALDLLAAEDPVKAELVKLRCFVGLSHQEAAEALNISRATADRYWAYAKSWLYCRLYPPEKNRRAP